VELREIVRAIVYDIVDDKARYLVLLAKKGYWQNPQGGIDPGENELEAIVREVYEESELRVLEVHKDTRVFMAYQTERKGEQICSTVAGYAVRVDSSRQVVLSVEEGHTAHMWVDYDGACSLLTKYPEQIELFEGVVSRLNV